MDVIKRFGVLNMAKVLAAVYFLLAAIFCITRALLRMFLGEHQGKEGVMGGAISGLGMFFLSLLYGAAGIVGGYCCPALQSGGGIYRGR